MRIELFFKSAGQLTSLLQFYAQRQSALPASPVLPFHQHSVFQAFNIPNKVRNEDIIPFTTPILDVFPGSDVCLHYSLKNHPCKRMDDASQQFITFMQEAKDAGAKEILLVSGSGAKRAINAVTLLQYLARYSIPLPEGVRIAVAFNPYYTTETEKQAEIKRLLEKLESKLVQVIYLQFGTNVEMLRESLQFLNEHVDRKQVVILGSTFLPSKQLIARMKFRPWAGLMLSEEFLSSVEEGEGIINQMLDLYEEFQVVPIVETAFKTEKETEHMEQLLRIKK